MQINISMLCFDDKMHAPGRKLGVETSVGRYSEKPHSCNINTCMSLSYSWQAIFILYTRFLCHRRVEYSRGVGRILEMRGQKRKSAHARNFLYRNSHAQGPRPHFNVRMRSYAIFAEGESGLTPLPSLQLSLLTPGSNVS